MWVWGLNQFTITSFVAKLWPKNLDNSLKSWPTSIMVVLPRYWIHLPIHNMGMFPNTLYMFEVDVGAIPSGSRAFPLMHHDIICICSPAAVIQQFHHPPKCLANKYGGSGMMVAPSDHPQHVNVPKHLVYAWSSMWHVGLGPHSSAIKKLRISLSKCKECGVKSFIIHFMAKTAEHL